MVPHSKRLAKSAAEIAALPTLGSTECLSRVRTNGATYCAETLVSLFRWATENHDSVFAEVCGRFLIGWQDPGGRWHAGHCEGIMANLAKHFGFARDSEEMLSFRSLCHENLWLAIRSGRDFWEIRFGLAFRQKCIEAAKAVIRERKRLEKMPPAIAAPELAANEDRADTDVSSVDEEVLTRLSNPIYQARIHAAVWGLPEKQGRAVFLRFFEGWAIEGASRNTISAAMGVSAREVYKLLRTGLETLKSDPELRAIWFGEV
jgi:DNA-directed RNA polymerase specialized sigma24 family protein